MVPTAVLPTGLGSEVLICLSLPGEAVNVAENFAASGGGNPNRLSFGPNGTPAADPTPGFRGIQHNNLAWRHDAASKAYSFADKFPAAQPLIRAAYRLLPLKADWEPHRIKLPMAAWKNFGWVSAAWRPHLLAAASYVFLGSDALDTDLAKEVRQAVEKL